MQQKHSNKRRMTACELDRL